MKLFDYISLIIVSIVWGTTNTLLKRYVSNDNEFSNSQRSRTTICELLFNFLTTIRNWKFTLTFLGNQSGSILFYWLLRELPLTVVVPVVNALTFLFTALTGYVLGEEKPNLRIFLGAAMIIVGIALCLAD